MPITLNTGVTNILNAPGIINDNFVNRPAISAEGVIFNSLDTAEIFVFDGTNWVLIANTGGGPPPTPGIDSVLAVGQLLTAARSIDCNNKDFDFNSVKTFNLKNQSNNIYLQQSGSTINLGDISNAGNRTKITLNDSTRVTNILCNTYLGLSCFFGTNTYRFGAIDTASNTGNNITLIRSGANINQFYWTANDFVNGNLITGINFLLSAAARTYQYGAINQGSATTLTIDDVLKSSKFTFFNGISTVDSGFNFDFTNYTYLYGAINAQNKTTLEINDTGTNISTYYYNGTNYVNDGINFNLSGKVIQLGLFNTGSVKPKISIENDVIATYFNTNISGIYFTSNTFKFGSIGYSNRINLLIDDSSSLAKFTQGSSDLREGLELDFSNKVYSLGDFNGNNNSCSIVIDDTSETENHITQSLIYDDNGTGNLIQATPSGPATGDHLKIKINGTDYVIELKTP